MSSVWDQHGSRVRLEWGAVGAREVAVGAMAVVVDVLSFTTTLSVAVDRGVVVHPHPWKDDSARALADRLGATLAVGRSAMGRSAVGRSAVARSERRPGEISLSPGSVRAAIDLDNLVLPSPNGSSIAHLLAGLGSPVIGACLRNRAAVARYLAERFAADPAATIALVPAGERWPDGSLRPAIEDLWGAGGVVAALLDLGMEQLGMEQLGMEQLGAEQLGAEQLGAEQLGAEQLGVQQLGAEQLGAEQLGAEQLGAEQLGVGQLGVGQLGVGQLGVAQAAVSEEARAAAAAYRLVEGRLGPALLACSSGRELTAIGYAGDVAIAAELDTSVVVPVLGPDGAFRAAAPTSIG